MATSLTSPNPSPSRCRTLKYSQPPNHRKNAGSAAPKADSTKERDQPLNSDAGQPQDRLCGDVGHGYEGGEDQAENDSAQSEFVGQDAFFQIAEDQRHADGAEDAHLEGRYGGSQRATW